MISFIFYFNVVLQSVLAAFAITLGEDHHYILKQIPEKTKIQGVYFLSYFLLAFPLGMLLAKKLLLGGESIRELLLAYLQQKMPPKREKDNNLWLAIITSICIASGIYILLQIGYLPLAKIFAITPAEMGQTRVEVSRNFPGNIYVRNILGLFAVPILSYIWLVQWRRQRDFSTLVGFIITTFFALNLLLYNFERGPLFFYLLGLLFLFFYIVGSIQPKHLAVAGVVLFAVVAGFHFKQHKSFKSSFQLDAGLVPRVVFGQAAGFYAMLEIYPQKKPWIGFASLSKRLTSLLVILPRKELHASHASVCGSFKSKASGCRAMSTLFQGEAWANFGLPGIIISPVYVGFLIGILYIFFLKSEKDPVLISFFVYYSTTSTVTGGFNDYLYDPANMVILAFLFLYNNAKEKKKV